MELSEDEEKKEEEEDKKEEAVKEPEPDYQVRKDEKMYVRSVFTSFLENLNKKRTVLDRGVFMFIFF